MKCLREHINSLCFNNLILSIHKFQISSLGGTIAAYIYHSVWSNIKYLLNYIFMHAITRRICNYNIWMSVLFNKGIIKYMFHGTYKKLNVLYVIKLCILFCGSYGVGNRFYTNYFFGLLGNKLSYGTRARI